MLKSDEVQKLLGRREGLPDNVSMEDNMLDVPEDKRAVIAKSPDVHGTVPNINPTIIPDRFLKTLTPIFTIRHPAKQIESWYKASRVLKVPMDHPRFELRAS